MLLVSYWTLAPARREAHPRYYDNDLQNGFCSTSGMVIPIYTADDSVGETAPSPISPEPWCRKDTIRGGRVGPFRRRRRRMCVPHRLRARSPRRVAAQIRLRAGRLGVARGHARLDEISEQRARLDVVRGPRPEERLRVQFVKAPSLDGGPVTDTSRNSVS